MKPRPPCRRLSQRPPKPAIPPRRRADRPRAMDGSSEISVSDASSDRSAAGLDKAPMVGGLFVGLIGSLCCGGGLVLGAIGLGALYSIFGMARFIPEALAGSAVLILLLNWLYYSRKAARIE